MTRRTRRKRSVERRLTDLEDRIPSRDARPVAVEVPEAVVEAGIEAAHNHLDNPSERETALEVIRELQHHDAPDDTPRTE